MVYCTERDLQEHQGKDNHTKSLMGVHEVLVVTACYSESCTDNDEYRASELEDVVDSYCVAGGDHVGEEANDYCAEADNEDPAETHERCVRPPECFTVRCS